jgi:hypothetical protein
MEWCDPRWVGAKRLSLGAVTVNASRACSTPASAGVSFASCVCDRHLSALSPDEWSTETGHNFALENQLKTYGIHCTRSDADSQTLRACNACVLRVAARSPVLPNALKWVCRPSRPIASGSWRVVAGLSDTAGLPPPAAAAAPAAGAGCRAEGARRRFSASPDRRRDAPWDWSSSPAARPCLWRRLTHRS